MAYRFLLAVIGLISPLLSLAGPFDAIGSAGSIIVSVVIAIIWIGFIVYMRVRKPVLVLEAAGTMYALLSVLLVAILQSFLPGALGEAPVSLSLL